MLYVIFDMKLTSGHQAGADEKRCLFPWIFSRKAREMSIHQDGIEAVCVLGLYIVHTDDSVDKETDVVNWQHG